MAVRYMPSVVPVAYPAFYELCDGRLPDTFIEWRLLEDDVRHAAWRYAGDHVVIPASSRLICRSIADRRVARPMAWRSAPWL